MVDYLYGKLVIVNSGTLETNLILQVLKSVKKANLGIPKNNIIENLFMCNITNPTKVVQQVFAKLA